MLARLPSAALRGLNTEAVDVEVDLSRGLPAWNMVGLPEAAVREARTGFAQLCLTPVLNSR